MRIKTIRVQSFKRFTDLTIADLPPNARVVMMVGQNGSGKSSLFDAFKVWHHSHGGPGSAYDPGYHLKQGLPPRDWGSLVSVEFHESLPTGQIGKLFYIRSSYRNEGDFKISSLHRMGSEFDAPRVPRMIDTETQLVGDNYQRLVSNAVEDVFSGQHDGKSVRELRESLIGEIRSSMKMVFGDINLSGLGNPLQDGSFFFEKGASKEFHYKNLSGGEKAAFDLILDMIIKRRAYDNTVYCIDEPDLHMHTRLQGRLLEEMTKLLPPNCQLWVATHSIGMMRKAKDLQKANPDQVVFLDFHDTDFDQARTMKPRGVTREYWLKTLEVALDDLAGLVAPRLVILCEGRPRGRTDTKSVEFDARCYRTIFANQYPDADFLSVGNELDVRTDRLEIGKAIETLVAGTKVVKLVDRDNRSDNEVEELKRAGVRVLTRRNLECYLLDDEVLASFCASVGKQTETQAVISAKAKAIQNSMARCNPPEDLKSASGEIYSEARRILNLPQAGSTTEAFLRDMLAPQISPSMRVYADLKRDVFGD